jgi:IS30 family transposase
MASHFSKEEREQLATYLALRIPKARIARCLNRPRCTIFREIQRNRCPVGYLAAEAQEAATARRPHRRRKMDCPQLARDVKARLRDRWSPDQIDGRARRDFLHDRPRRISRQTIYNWLKQSAGEEYRKYLRFYRVKKRQTAFHVAEHRLFANRPGVINRRERFGDWEADTIIGRKSLSKPVLYSLVERSSGYLELGRAENREAATANRVLRNRLRNHPPHWRLSVTSDNGPEFTKLQELEEQLGIATYHADPYKAWQRGTNENTNGLIRQFFPKGTDFRNIHPRLVKMVESLLNNRPRKRLGYQTPEELKNKYR